MNALGPQVIRAADSHSFGQIDLGNGAMMSFGVPSGVTGAPQGHTQYDFVLGGTRLFFRPPYEKGEKQRLTQDDGKGPLPTKEVAGVRAVDIPLTEYRDMFRVTIQKDSSNWTLFGLSALQDGTQIGGIHTRLIGVEQPRLEEFSVLPDHASFIVDPDNGMDPLNISSALDPPKNPQGRPIQGAPLTSHRDHGVGPWRQRRSHADIPGPPRQVRSERLGQRQGRGARRRQRGRGRRAAGAGEAYALCRTLVAAR